jgi:hypothetical protein
MQKAIYYVSRLIAARGIVELTDRHLNFQVSHLDASFGIKDVAIDICSIVEVNIHGGEIHPKVVVSTTEKRYEFVLAKGQELYDNLKSYTKDPLSFRAADDDNDSMMCSSCGKWINRIYSYCPWCGSRA